MKITIDFVTLSLSKCINAPLLLLETALIGRILGPGGFGQWSLLLAAATLLHSFTINWTHAMTIKFGCEEWSRSQDVSQTISTRTPIIIFGLFISILLVVFQPMNWLSKLYFLNPPLGWLVFLNMLSLWLTFEAQSNLQVRGLLSYQAMITPLITCVSIIFLLSILLTSNRSDLVSIAVGVSIIRCLSWGATWLFGLKSTNFHWQFPVFNNIKNAIYFGWPLIPTFMLGYLSLWGNHVLLGIFCTAKEVGLWGASYQMILGFIAMNTILVTVLLPWLISKSQISNEAAKFYISTVIPTVFSLWLLAVVIFVTFLPALFLVFMGEQFERADTLLLILSCSILTSAFSSLYSILFNQQNRLRAVLIYNLIMVIINLSVSLVLIPKIGSIGAAIGTSLSYLIGQCLYILDQHLFLKVSVRKIGILFLTTLLIALLQYFAGVQLWHRLFCCLISLIFIIITIRKSCSIQPMFISQFFTGVLNPIGFFLRRILVSEHANEYH